MLLDTKSGITYGPVRSRRLGRSLGINLLPPRQKLCTFDCLYCQYGWSDPAALQSLASADFPTVDDVLAAVARALEELTEPPTFLTFSGHGEPTLHPRFADIVAGVTSIRDRVCRDAQTAILSNSSRLHEEAVVSGLRRLDLRIMKLDAGTDQGLLRFNRPIDGLRLADLAEGLRSLGDVTVQSLFAAGPAGNTGPEELWSWIDVVVSIAPRAVQIYTLARGYPSPLIAPAAPEVLTSIRDWLTARGVPARVF